MVVVALKKPDAGVDGVCISVSPVSLDVSVEVFSRPFNVVLPNGEFAFELGPWLATGIVGVSNHVEVVVADVCTGLSVNCWLLFETVLEISRLHE